MHKFIMINLKNKSVLPYLNTTVDFEKSFGEIQKLLMKFGCSDLMTRRQPSIVPNPDLKLNCDLYTIGFMQNGNRFLIEFPVFIISLKNGEKRVNMKASGRAMFNKIKSLLVDVELEFLSFEQAMMPFQLISDGSGKNQTISEYVDIHRAEMYSGKHMFMLGSGN